MMPVSPTTRPALKFGPGKMTQTMKVSANKIGWFHTKTNKAGASFDILIKDGLGRLKMKQLNCKSATDQFGQLINLPTQMGEELHISLENVKNADEVDVYIN